MTLGMKRIFPLVKAVALKSALPENTNLNEFWQRSSMAASACALYAELVNMSELADNAYMLGLFHIAGVPIMLQRFDDYQYLLNKGINEGWENICELEHNQYQMSHTTLGALLAQQWKLPLSMVEVIYYFHDVEGIFESGELSKVSLYLLSILKLARASVDEILGGKLESNEWLMVRDQVIEILNIDEVQLEEMQTEVKNRLSKDVK